MKQYVSLLLMFFVLIGCENQVTNQNNLIPDFGNIPPPVRPVIDQEILVDAEILDDYNDLDERIEDIFLQEDYELLDDLDVQPEVLESCMVCHNSATSNKYDGNGIENPHPFPPADSIKCTTCHGGNGQVNGKSNAHVSPPPQIGDSQYQVLNPKAFFNRTTLSGIDKLQPENYTDANGNTYSNLDYLQFINPGDLRVVKEGKGCGISGCHGDQHGDWVSKSTIATTNGIFSSTRFITGLDNDIAEYRISEEGNALSDYAPRSVENALFSWLVREIGEVGVLLEQKEWAQYDGFMRQNNGFDANALANDIDNTDLQRPNRIRNGSNLEKLVTEAISITCGDCHLYSAGANNRYADFRSSGCSACHMEYSLDGKSRSSDPNINKIEPANPDQIAPGERSHPADHVIRNISKTVNNVQVRGITDNACVGCHQGSNRTVLQFWGIRLDQNKDLTNNFQYPNNPQNFTNTANDRRLFDPAVNNNTFNGRDADQYILFEDYDGDGLDDTPPDIHYERGLGCIDCHSSRDLHGGTAGDPTSGKMQSRQDQSTFITCENCHGTIEDYASTIDCLDYDNQNSVCVQDKLGNPLRHVTVDPAGNYWLKSKVFGTTHYISQIKDITRQTNKAHPRTGQLLYNPKAAYGMGRIGVVPGSGPIQADPLKYSQGFSHTDDLDCASCHASWANNCIGCHLRTDYNDNPNEYFFSNITGERILLAEGAADFVYQSPILSYLGMNSRGYITQIDPAEKMFYRYVDLNGNESQVFAFGDRLGEGNNPNLGGRNTFPALAMNQMAPHSIRGRISPNQNAEPMKYCVSCHLTQNAIDTFGDEYTLFRDLYFNNDFQGLFDNGFYELLQVHIGSNTNNQLDSPFYIQMITGLGTSLFLFDANGCPVNPLDANANREYCNGNAPADNFDQNNVVYDLDRIVEITGQTNSSSAHPRIDNRGPRRDGNNYNMSGPLNRQLIEKLSDPNLGLILDSWLDADGNVQGEANNFIQ